MPETKSRSFPYGWPAGALALLTAATLSSGVLGQDIPSAIADDRPALLTVHAEGVQIYACVIGGDGKAAWTFREPLAILTKDGKTVGRHFIGPSWEMADDSAVVGKVVAQAPGATGDDIAVLKLDVAQHRGEGQLSAVQGVLRLNTQGGVFSGACDRPGALHLQPYSADYVFLGA